VTVSQDGEEEMWPAETVCLSDGSALKAYPLGAGAWTWDEIGPETKWGARKRGDVVKYSKPVNKEEAEVRLILLNEPEKGLGEWRLRTRNDQRPKYLLRGRGSTCSFLCPLGAPIAQLDRASDYGSEGFRFNS
jgi:hypothetical protein